MNNEAIKFARDAQRAELEYIASHYTLRERRKPSEQLIRIYRASDEHTWQQVVDALMGALLPESDPWSYHPNLYSPYPWSAHPEVDRLNT